MLDYTNVRARYRTSIDQKREVTEKRLSSPHVIISAQQVNTVFNLWRDFFFIIIK